MPLVPFSTLPAVARLWVFASESAVEADSERTLLDVVDEYLLGWRAHGTALTVGRDWRDHRFLAVAVDPRASDASGCSIDALFRVLKQLEQVVGTSLTSGGRVYFRDAAGVVQVTDRPGFIAMAQSGAVSGDTVVFDTTVQSAGEWNERFETNAARSWHGTLLPAMA